MAETAIHFTGVNKWYGKLHVLREINLAIGAGEVVVVCGPSGSGKSTLIRTVNGLERVQSGDVVVLGDSITRRGVNLPGLHAHEGRHASIALIAAVLAEYERTRRPVPEASPLDAGPSAWARSTRPGAPS